MGTDMALSTLDKLYACNDDGSWRPTPKLGSCEGREMSITCIHLNQSRDVLHITVLYDTIQLLS